jgi:hypothetical protein
MRGGKTGNPPGDRGGLGTARLKHADVTDQVFRLGGQRGDTGVLTPTQIAGQVRRQCRLARCCHSAKLHGEADLADRASISGQRKAQQPGNPGIDRLDDPASRAHRQPLPVGAMDDDLAHAAPARWSVLLCIPSS